MNTGVKQRFNLIDLGEDAITEDCSTESDNWLTTFAENLAEGDDGTSVGVIGPARITHATPAAIHAETCRNRKRRFPRVSTAAGTSPTNCATQSPRGWWTPR